MFATLAGGYPRPDLPPDASVDDLVRTAIAELEEAAIGDSRNEGQLFKAAHRRLTQTAREAHLTLAVRDGSIASIPPAVLFDAPYRSYAIDVVTHPENWQIVIAGQAERGMI